jgi:hypothetical protein
MHLLGEIIGYLFMFMWVPYASYTITRNLVGFIGFTPKEAPAEPVALKQKAPPQAPPKGSYPVHASFREEHRITNPVEFDD